MNAAAGSWFERLSICLHLVFLIGAPSVLITRAIFYAYHPENFVDSSPTISETASHPPASDFFLGTMILVTACIAVSWSLNITRNRYRLGLLAAQGMKVAGPMLLAGIASVLGIAAGFWLATVSVYTLNNGHDVHMMGSWAFYICQALSITLDILFVLWMRRLAPSPFSDDRLWQRIAVAAGIFLGSWFFLYMYLSKDFAAPENRYAIQLVYVGAEYLVALLFLIYPMTAYAEMRRHFREFAGDERKD